MYAHCAKPSDLYKKGSVVLYILNLKQVNATISLTTKELYQSTRDIYWLEPGDDNGLRSKLVGHNLDHASHLCWKIINSHEILLFLCSIVSSHLALL